MKILPKVSSYRTAAVLMLVRVARSLMMLGRMSAGDLTCTRKPSWAVLRSDQVLVGNIFSIFLFF